VNALGALNDRIFVIILIVIRPKSFFKSQLMTGLRNLSATFQFCPWTVARSSVVGLCRIVIQSKVEVVVNALDALNDRKFVIILIVIRPNSFFKTQEITRLRNLSATFE
jgi:hypothetical protein